MIEEYRKAVRGLYNAHHGEESLKTPTREEWDAFAAICSMRDMGTHLCAFPMGDHCSRGLLCLGCRHAQPKKSAVVIFRRCWRVTSGSYRVRSRDKSRGQIAARDLEVARIHSALRRAEELPHDAVAIEGTLAVQERLEPKGEMNCESLIGR